MPLGMSWPKYVSLISLSLGSMLAGASAVHHYYDPDLSIPDGPVSKPKSVIAQPRIEIVPPRGHRDGKDLY